MPLVRNDFEDSFRNSNQRNGIYFAINSEVPQDELDGILKFLNRKLRTRANNRVTLSNISIIQAKGKFESEYLKAEKDRDSYLVLHFSDSTKMKTVSVYFYSKEKSKKRFQVGEFTGKDTTSDRYSDLICFLNSYALSLHFQQASRAFKE